jgi:hypothetical protein
MVGPQLIYDGIASGNLGRGYGDPYAHDPVLDRRVAIKQMTVRSRTTKSCARLYVEGGGGALNLNIITIHELQEGAARSSRSWS